MSCEATPDKHLPKWIIDEIERIIHRGNHAEVKKEYGKYVVIEVKRKLIKEN